MTPDEFFAAVDSERRLRGLGICNDAGRTLAIIEEKRSGITTAVDLASLPALTWPDLAPVLLGLREPNPIYHISRVCGYYSRVENWNESKRGELADRQKGQAGYRVEDEQ